VLGDHRRGAANNGLETAIDYVAQECTHRATPTPTQRDGSPRRLARGSRWFETRAQRAEADVV